MNTKKIYEKKKEGSNCSKFPAPVELCRQNKNIFITKVDNINMIRKQRNLLAKIRNALVKCFEEIKRLARSFPLF
jgi:hypothetical protein